MKKILLAGIAVLAFAGSAHAERLSLGCTPLPVRNAKPDPNPTMKINIDLEFTDNNGNELKTPIIHVLHFLANGGKADRWGQYEFVGSDSYQKDGATDYVYMGKLRVNPHQIIGMSLWTPPKDSYQQDWFYEEYISNDNERLAKHLISTARCTRDNLHDWSNN
jgi:hypothetical protein